MIKQAAFLFALTPFLSFAVPPASAQTPSPVTSDTAKLAWVDAEQAGALNLRAGPSTDYRVLRVMKHGAPLTVLGRDGNWARVVQHDTETLGWAYAPLVSSQAPKKFVETAQQSKEKDKHRTIPTYRKPAWVIAPRGALNMRSGPGRRFPVRSSLSHGTQLTVLAQYGDWREVRLKNGRGGWVHGDFLTRQRPIVTTPPKHGIRSIHRSITPDRGPKDHHRSRNNGPQGRIVFRWSN